MKKKMVIFMMSLALLSPILTACNGAGNNNEQPEDVTYEPTRYDGDNQNNQGNMNNNGNTGHPAELEDRNRNGNNQDGPFNMDEEEPDLDEERSEERRDG